MATTVKCPACSWRACPADLWKSAGVTAPRAIGPCPACAWAFTKGRAARTHWQTAADLPRPASMGDEEFAFRSELFAVWKTRPASELASQLRVFADWLPHANLKKHDPVAWHQWKVPIALRAWWEVYGGDRGADRSWADLAELFDGVTDPTEAIELFERRATGPAPERKDGA